MIEKLLRSCDGIQTIYILIRNKKSKTANERAEEYISDPIFEINGLKSSGVCHKIEPIFGDLLLPGLGISGEDRQRLIKTVNIVIHSAASIRLDAPLRYAIERNLKPMPQLIELCHEMQTFNSFVYLSALGLLNYTANPKEMVSQNTSVSPELVIKSCDLLSDKEMEKMRKFLFSEYLNTYYISKSLAEQLLLRESSRLNIAIVRPSAVISSSKEPTPGWVYHAGYGSQIFISPFILVGLGILKVFPNIDNGAQGIIPVDYVANAIIASAWFVSNQKLSRF